MNYIKQASLIFFLFGFITLVISTSSSSASSRGILTSAELHERHTRISNVKNSFRSIERIPTEHFLKHRGHHRKKPKSHRQAEGPSGYTHDHGVSSRNQSNCRFVTAIILLVTFSL